MFPSKSIPYRILQYLSTSLALIFWLAGAPAMAQGASGEAFFPTGDVTDSRMLSLGCADLPAHGGPLSVQLAIPRSEASFDLRIFDGDTASLDPNDVGHWDAGGVEITYRLYFDPLSTGNTTAEDLVGEWRGNSPNPPVNPNPDPDKAWSTSAALMPDNDWWTVTVAASARAAAPSGTRFYHLVAEPGDCTGAGSVFSNFKLAVSASSGIEVQGGVLEAALRQGAADAEIIYGTWPPTGPTFFLDTASTYDGQWDLPFRVQEERVDLRLFDGDFEVGTNETQGAPSGVQFPACGDLDDPDTDNTYSGFPSTVPTQGASPEGSATGGLADDSQLDVFRRGEPGDPAHAGCVRYGVADPAGVAYANANPSGSDELEQFRLATQLADNPNTADYGPSVSADGMTFIDSDVLPSGIWNLHLTGLDLANTLSVHGARFCGVGTSGPACNPPVFLLSPLVFRDRNGNGAPDPGERRIRGVVLELLRETDQPPVDRTFTGEFTGPAWEVCLAFGVPATRGRACFGANRTGSFTVRVADVNFVPGGALRGMGPTSGSNVFSGNLSATQPSNYLAIALGYRRAE